MRETQPAPGLSERPLKVAMILADDRETQHRHDLAEPFFGPAPTALLTGLERTPGVEVHIVACVRQAVREPGPLADNIFYHAVRIPRWGMLRSGYLPCIRAVRRKLRELEPDVVHGQGTEGYQGVTTVFCGYPNVLTIHGNMKAVARALGSRWGSYHWWAAQLETLALSRTNGVFCNSAYTEGLVRPRTRKTWRVPNALLPEFFAPLPQRQNPVPPVLVVLANISCYKRQVELLDLAQRLHASGTRFTLQFLGRSSDSDYGRLFQSRVQAAEKAGYARYLGFQPPAQLVPLLDEASALVHTPTEEAFGLAVAEGLARNLKFFGTRIGGVIDIASQVEMAELFEADDWDGLGRAIARWIESGCARPTLAAAEMKRRYDPIHIARRHLEIYREVLGARR